MVVGGWKMSVGADQLVALGHPWQKAQVLISEEAACGGLGKSLSLSLIYPVTKLKCHLEPRGGGRGTALC